MRLDADAYRVQPVADPTFSVSRLRPAALAELRWPFGRAGEGHVDLLEPVVQVVVAPRIDEAGVPNRDSLVPELDRGNLVSFSRYPGVDRRESGNRVQFGLGLTRRAASGASREVVLGGIVRPGADALFAPEPGAAGWSGEWLVAARLDGADGRTVRSLPSSLPAGAAGVPESVSPVVAQPSTSSANAAVTRACARGMCVDFSALRHRVNR